jgi:hypothetical protein
MTNPASVEALLLKSERDQVITLLNICWRDRDDPG